MLPSLFSGTIEVESLADGSACAFACSWDGREEQARVSPNARDISTIVKRIQTNLLNSTVSQYNHDFALTSSLRELSAFVEHSFSQRGLKNNMQREASA